jgi:hypothetical protein
MGMITICLKWYEFVNQGSVFFLTLLPFRPHEYNLSTLEHGTCAYTLLVSCGVSRREQHSRSVSSGLDYRWVDVPIPEGVRYQFSKASRTALGSWYRLVHWVPVVLSPGVKRPAHKAGHWTLSNARLKNAWNHASISPYALMPCIGSTLLYVTCLYFYPCC